jgi:hypothetical protein
MRNKNLAHVTWRNHQRLELAKKDNLDGKKRSCFGYINTWKLEKQLKVPS